MTTLLLARQVLKARREGSQRSPHVPTATITVRLFFTCIKALLLRGSCRHLIHFCNSTFHSLPETPTERSLHTSFPPPPSLGVTPSHLKSSVHHSLTPLVTCLPRPLLLTSYKCALILSSPLCPLPGSPECDILSLCSHKQQLTPLLEGLVPKLQIHSLLCSSHLV